MTINQSTLPEATTRYVDAEEALRIAMNAPNPSIASIRPAWDEAEEARRAYADALTAEGHSVPVGLLGQE